MNHSEIGFNLSYKSLGPRKRPHIAHITLLRGSRSSNPGFNASLHRSNCPIHASPKKTVQQCINQQTASRSALDGPLQIPMLRIRTLVTHPGSRPARIAAPYWLASRPTRKGVDALSRKLPFAVKRLPSGG